MPVFDPDTLDESREMDDCNHSVMVYSVGGLEEASDIHWLNSVDGEACLLVDSYRDLRDGEAVAEVVAVLQGRQYVRADKIPAARVAGALEALAATIGRSSVPPRLLQRGFTWRICEAEPTACRDLVGFLKRLYQDRHVENQEGGHGAVREQIRGKEYNQQRSKPPFGSRGPHCRDEYCDREGCKSRQKMIEHPDTGAASTAVSARSTAAKTQRRFRVKVDDGGSDQLEAQHIQRVKPRSSSLVPPVRPTATAWIKTSGNDRTGCVDRAEMTAAKSTESRLSKRKSETRRFGVIPQKQGGHSLLQKLGRSAPWSSVQGTRCKVGKAVAQSNLSALGEKDGVSRNAEKIAQEMCRPRKSVERGRDRKEKDGMGRQRSRDSLLNKEAAKRSVALRETVTAGRQRANRRDVLRWMERLGLKVEWAILTPEGAPCHERLSNGELLCELAAAVDYAVSGGRGLPLVEMPSCPGRFVLRGTCGSSPPNAAQARHNVKIALRAFKTLGGVGGAWLGSEEAVVEGDDEAVWGLLRDIYVGYGRIRPQHRPMFSKRTLADLNHPPPEPPNPGRPVAATPATTTKSGDVFNVDKKGGMKRKTGRHGQGLPEKEVDGKLSSPKRDVSPSLSKRNPVKLMGATNRADPGAEPNAEVPRDTEHDPTTSSRSPPRGTFSATNGERGGGGGGCGESSGLVGGVRQTDGNTRKVHGGARGVLWQNRSEYDTEPAERGRQPLRDESQNPCSTAQRQKETRGKSLCIYHATRAQPPPPLQLTLPPAGLTTSRLAEYQPHVPPKPPFQPSRPTTSNGQRNSISSDPTSRMAAAPAAGRTTLPTARSGVTSRRTGNKAVGSDDLRVQSNEQHGDGTLRIDASNSARVAVSKDCGICALSDASKFQTQPPEGQERRLGEKSSARMLRDSRAGDGSDLSPSTERNVGCLSGRKPTPTSTETGGGDDSVVMSAVAAARPGPGKPSNGNPDADALSAVVVSNRPSIFSSTGYVETIYQTPNATITPPDSSIKNADNSATGSPDNVVVVPLKLGEDQAGSATRNRSEGTRFIPDGGSSRSIFASVGMAAQEETAKWLRWNPGGRAQDELKDDLWGGRRTGGHDRLGLAMLPAGVEGPGTLRAEQISSLQREIQSHGVGKRGGLDNDCLGNSSRHGVGESGVLNCCNRMLSVEPSSIVAPVTPNVDWLLRNRVISSSAVGGAESATGAVCAAIPPLESSDRRTATQGRETLSVGNGRVFGGFGLSGLPLDLASSTLPVDPFRRAEGTDFTPLLFA